MEEDDEEDDLVPIMEDEELHFNKSNQLDDRPDQNNFASIGMSETNDESKLFQEKQDSEFKDENKVLQFASDGGNVWSNLENVETDSLELIPSEATNDKNENVEDEINGKVCNQENRNNISNGFKQENVFEEFGDEGFAKFASNLNMPADPEEEVIVDPIAAWGQPMGLPSPDPTRKKKKDPNLSTASTPAATQAAAPAATQAAVSASANKIPLTAPQSKKAETKKQATHSKSASAVQTTDVRKSEAAPNQRLKNYSESTKKNESTKPDTFPFYTDLTYINDADDLTSLYNVELFKKVRSRCYVLSGTELNLNILDQLLEAKENWQEDCQMTIVSTSDWSEIQNWIQSKGDRLNKLKINIEQGTSGCPIDLAAGFNIHPI
jgi:hypothetical protein